MSGGIIVGYDGSDCAKAALRAALEVAKAYNEKVTIAFGYEVNPMAGEVQDYAAALRELAHKRVEEAAGIAAAEDGRDRRGDRREVRRRRRWSSSRTSATRG